MAPPLIPQTTLADRIARLNLVDGSTSPSSSQSSSLELSGAAGANTAGTPSSASSSSTSYNSTQLRTTGAVGRISDKISRFQANAEDAPLIPGHLGSFGLGGVRREPSSGISGAGGGDRRVTSLGLGRAAVPLSSVTPSRSASTGGNGPSSATTTPRLGSSSLSTRSSSPSASLASPTTISTSSGTLDSSNTEVKDDDADSSGGTPTSSRASSQYGGSPSVDLKSSSSGGSDLPKSIRGLFPRNDSSLSVASSETTAGGSESSLNVETGSLISEVGPDPKSITAADSLATGVSSPLSSPILSALVNPLEITVDEPELSPHFTTTPGSHLVLGRPLRGPLDALKTPSRSKSSVSVSSMLVETGSVASEDGGDGESTTSGGPLTPRAEEDERPFPTTVGNVDDDEVSSGIATPNRSEQDEEAREQATRAELAKYEDETFDAVAPRFTDGSDEEVEDGEENVVVEEKEVEGKVDEVPFAARPGSAQFVVDSPIRPREQTPTTTEAEDFTPESPADDGVDSYTDMIDGYGSPTPNAPSPSSSPMPGGMPMVKCSDCGTDVDLMELVDHVCAPAAVAAARSPSSPSPSPNSIRSFPAPPTVSAPPPGRNSGLSSPVVSTERVVSPTSPTSAYDSPSVSPSRSRLGPDAFVAQVESDVPDDILDAYDDDREDDDELDGEHNARHGTEVKALYSSKVDLPDDVGPEQDDDDLYPTQPVPPHPSVVTNDQADLPEDVDDSDALATSTATLSPINATPSPSASPKLNLGVPQPRESKVRARGPPKSVYDMIGGDLDDSGDEDYEGGSAKIVSVTHATHSLTR